MNLYRQHVKRCHASQIDNPLSFELDKRYAKVTKAA
jgi:hypothetical protein